LLAVQTLLVRSHAMAVVLAKRDARSLDHATLDGVPTHRRRGAPRDAFDAGTVVFAVDPKALDASAVRELKAITNAAVRGILPDCLVTVVSVQWFGSEAVELTNETSTGQVANGRLFRHDERVAEHDRVALPPARGAISQHCAPCSVRRRPAAHLDGLDPHPVRGSDAS